MLKKNKQTRIGLTGGIGSGKTYISNLLIKLGFKVFNADFEAKKCILENDNLIQKIQNAFGDHVCDNGLVNNKALAKIVFNNKQKLSKLNNLIHPIVKKKFHDWCVKQDSHIVFKETAILFESGSFSNIDKVICISSSKEVRISRVMQRDNISRQDVITRMNNQMSQDNKEKLSDFIIKNNEHELLIPQLLNVINQIG